MNKTMPEIRFKYFDTKYNKVTLSEVVDKIKSYSLSRDVETVEFTGYKYIHYGDIHTKKAALVKDSNILPNIGAGDYVSLQKDDLVLADASEDYKGIATPSLVLNIPKQKLIAGLHTIALRPKNKYSSTYIYYLLQSHSFKKFGYRTGTGMKVFGISYPNLIKFENLYPNLKEQQKIGDFFKQLDDMITLQQQLLEQQQQYKKAMLQKMFLQKGERVPKVRFDGFSGEWKETMLSNIFESRNIKQVPTTEAPLMAFTSTGGVEEKGERFNREFLVKDKNKTYKRTELNDLIYSSNNLDVGAIGRNKYGTAVISDVYEIFQTKNSTTPEFSEIIIKQKSFLNKVLKYRQGALYGQYRIYASDFLSVNILIPSFKEQQKIGTFFRQLDDIIALHQKKLEDYQQLKKALLKRMFV